jgi:hypothetical protein
LANPVQPDSWTKTGEPDHVLVRTTAGEYLQPISFKDGTFAVVSPIQDVSANQFGFTFWRFAPRGE